MNKIIIFLFKIIIICDIIKFLFTNFLLNIFQIEYLKIFIHLILYYLIHYFKRIFGQILKLKVKFCI